MSSTERVLYLWDSDLWQFLNKLTSGELVLLSSETAPPWFEPGVNCEVSKDIYSNVLELFPPLWSGGSVFVTTSAAGPLRTFWCSRGKLFGRELTAGEIAQFRLLVLGQAGGGRTSGTIRLGCLYCDRSDFDGVDRLPHDWTEIGRVQSFEQSRQPCGFSDTFGKSCFDWQTHLGVCPECPAEEESNHVTIPNAQHDASRVGQDVGVALRPHRELH